MNTVKHECKITFTWDNENDTRVIDICTPESVSREKVEKELKEGHEFLCFKDGTDIYGTVGRTPDTLAMYVCEKNGWAFNIHKPETCLVFD